MSLLSLRLQPLPGIPFAAATRCAAKVWSQSEWLQHMPTQLLSPVGPWEKQSRTPSKSNCARTGVLPHGQTKASKKMGSNSRGGKCSSQSAWMVDADVPQTCRALARGQLHSKRCKGWRAAKRYEKAWQETTPYSQSWQTWVSSWDQISTTWNDHIISGTLQGGPKGCIGEQKIVLQSDLVTIQP